MRRRGFTLVELLAVATCLVLLIVIVLYAVISAQERARIVQCAANLRAIGQACSGYANNNRGWYPLHGAKDQNTFTADVSPFTGGSGYWFGDATYQGTDRYQDGPPDNTRYAYSGIAQLLLNPGSYRTKGQYNIDGQYLSDWRAFYCPNQLETTFFSSFSRTYNVLDPDNPYDSSTNTDKVIGTVSGNTIATYFSIAAKQRQAAQLPEIGYCATNGNSPGYMTPTYNVTGSNAGRNKMWRYQGKYVYDSTGAIFAGKDASGNERFAAGFITDAPETIIMADVALCSVSGTTVTLAFAERGRSDYLSFSHDTGLNTLYSGGNVAYMPLKSQTISTTSVYYGNNKGATVFGPR